MAPSVTFILCDNVIGTRSHLNYLAQATRQVWLCPARLETARQAFGEALGLLGPALQGLLQQRHAW